MSRAPAPLDAAAEARVRAAVAAAFQKAHELWGVEVPACPVTFDLRGRAAGMARWSSANGYSIRMNPEAYRLDAAHTINETVPHEVAHVVARVMGHGFNHGAAWRRICIALGGTGARCHNMALPPARTVRRFRYRLECGREVMLTRKRHQLLQTGKARLRLHDTGAVVCASHYVADAPAPAPAAAKARRAPPPAPARAPVRASVPPPRPACMPGLFAVPAPEVEIVEAIETLDGRLYLAAFDADLGILALYGGIEARLEDMPPLADALQAVAARRCGKWSGRVARPQPAYDALTHDDAYRVIGRWTRRAGLDLHELELSAGPGLAWAQDADQPAHDTRRRRAA